jgi:hypothetical protein
MSEPSGQLMPSMSDPDCQGDARVEGAAVLATLQGTADFNVQEVFDRVLREVHETALRTGATEIRLDVRKLEFVASACLKRVATWLASLTTARTAPYRVVFLSNPRVSWQRRSLLPLQNLAAEFVSIET